MNEVKYTPEEVKAAIDAARKEWAKDQRLRDAAPKMLDALLDVATFTHRMRGKMPSVAEDEALAALSETVDAALSQAMGLTP